MPLNLLHFRHIALLTLLILPKPKPKAAGCKTASPERAFLAPAGLQR